MQAQAFTKLVSPAVFGSVLAMVGCASITDGTTQTIIFKVDPQETRCTLTREGTELGSVSGKQNTITVGKGARDIIVACRADGYELKTQRLVSSTQTSGVVGGVFLDLGITDMITGAMWKYPGEVSIVMAKENTGALAQGGAAPPPQLGAPSPAPSK